MVGLGKLPRVVETLAARPQLQERLTEEIADALQAGLDPLGVLVVLDAAHQCVTTRGVRQTNSTTVTSLLFNARHHFGESVDVFVDFLGFQVARRYDE